MLGIGNRLEKQTKIKILAEKSKEFTSKYDELLESGMSPSEATKYIEEEQKMKRTNLSSGFTQPPTELNGAIHLGYSDAHKTLSTTKQMFQDSGMGTTATIPKSAQEHQDYIKMKERIQKDHLKEDAEIDFGEEPKSDYKRNFVDDPKMKEIRPNMDKQFNQRKHDLKEYAEVYIKTKDSLRKC